jgi:hypothetical protein
LANINSSPVSKPFVISAIILLILGSIIGSIWIMSLYGIEISSEILSITPFHRILQLDGFLSLLILGIGYMIIPRFRNVLLPKPNLAYVSFGLVIVSIALTFLEYKDNFIFILSYTLRLVGIGIFSAIVLWLVQIRPKLLRKSDYFFVMSITIFITVNVLSIVFNQINFNFDPLSQIHMWLLFPILMIFGVQYKFLPSFIGFMRPKNKTGNLAIILTGLCCILGVLSTLNLNEYFPLVFSFVLLSSAVSFAISLYIFGGFDNSEIKKLFRGEKKARFDFLSILTKISFSFLFLAIVMSILYRFNPEFFTFYDLTIHYTSIGFIGFTVMLFLPLMLPPIINKSIQFLKFNKFPIFLVLIALGLRTLGDLMFFDSILLKISGLEYLFGLSGWLIVIALFVFVIMIHRSMKTMSSDLQTI